MCINAFNLRLNVTERLKYRRSDDSETIRGLAYIPIDPIELFDKVTQEEKCFLRLNQPSASGSSSLHSLLGSVLRTLFMAIHELIGRQALATAVVVGSFSASLVSAPAAASLLPPSSRAQLLSSPSAVPTRSIPYVIPPERRAMLNTIRYAEGTWKGGMDVGYRVMFGGGLMSSLDRHPDRVIYSTRYASAAAGAYQFMPFTWNLVQRSIGVVGFGPEAQDQGALFLIQRRKALGLTDAGTLTPVLTAMLAPEWASFPTLAGRSFYGQPVKKYARLRSFYNLNLEELRRLRDQRREELSQASSSSDVCLGSRIFCATSF